MKASKIIFDVELDNDDIPEKIRWNASDKGDSTLKETKSVSISLWDHENKNTMRIDLWTKEMPVEEMKRFCIDCIGGLGQTILNATGDKYMADELNKTCDNLVNYLKKESN